MTDAAPLFPISIDTAITTRFPPVRTRESNSFADRLHSTQHRLVSLIIPRIDARMDTLACRGLTRRRLLGATAAGAVTALAGCGHLVNAIGNFVLEEVNLFKATDSRRRGALNVEDPSGTTVLDTRFDVPADTDEQTTGVSTNETAEEESAGETYTDVFTTAGAYTVSIALDADSAINEDRRDTGTAQITNPSDERLAIYLHDEVGAPATIIAFTEFLDLAEALNRTETSEPSSGA